MKYLLFIAVLVVSICAIDASVPDEAQAVLVTPRHPAVKLGPNLKETCSPAPLIVDSESDMLKARTVRWFPGKGILRAVRRIRNR